MKNIFLILIVISACIFSSCEKAKDLLPPQKFKAEDFPITMGSYWEYHWLDIFRNKTDTMKGTIIAEGIKLDDQSDLWMLEWITKHNTRRPDTQYVHKTEERIIFYDYSRFSDSLILESQYNFPFEVGDGWTMERGQGTYEVLGDRVNSTPEIDKDFGNGLFLKRLARGDNLFSLIDQALLIKDIGVAYRMFNVSFGQVPFFIERFELIDYEIKK